MVKQQDKTRQDKTQRTRKKNMMGKWLNFVVECVRFFRAILKYKKEYNTSFCQVAHSSAIANSHKLKEKETKILQPQCCKKTAERASEREKTQHTVREMTYFHVCTLIDYIQVLHAVFLLLLPLLLKKKNCIAGGQVRSDLCVNNNNKGKNKLN